MARLPQPYIIEVLINSKDTIDENRNDFFNILHSSVSKRYSEEKQRRKNK